MRIAITGGIAEGKSTVLAYLAELGFRVDSADKIAQELFETEDVRFELERLLAPKPYSRDSLREFIAEGDENRRKINHILHPRIVATLEESDAQFVEIPLLIEIALQWRYDRVWVVTCGQEEQLRRLTERTGNEAVARIWIKTQLPTSAKIVFADQIIRTNQDFDSVQHEVRDAIEKEFCK